MYCALIDLPRFTYSPWLTCETQRDYRKRGHACGETDFNAAQQRGTSRQKLLALSVHFVFLHDDNGRAAPTAWLSCLECVYRCSLKAKSDNDLISLSILPLSVFFSPLGEPSSHSQQLLLGNSTQPQYACQCFCWGKYTQLEGLDTSCKSLIAGRLNWAETMRCWFKKK